MCVLAADARILVPKKTNLYNILTQCRFHFLKKKMVFTIDVWTYISSFLFTFKDAKALLHTYHNSRVGVLRSFTLWTRVFPELIKPFLTIQNRGGKDFGGYCMYVLFQRYQKRLKFLVNISDKRIARSQLVIQREDVKIWREKDANIKRKSRMTDECHFDIKESMGLNKTQAKKAIVGTARKRGRR